MNHPAKWQYPQSLIAENPELRGPVAKAYAAGYDAGWMALRRRADIVIAAQAILGVVVVLHLAGLF